MNTKKAITLMDSPGVKISIEVHPLGFTLEFEDKKDGFSSFIVETSTFEELARQASFEGLGFFFTEDLRSMMNIELSNLQQSRDTL